MIAATVVGWGLASAAYAGEPARVRAPDHVRPLASDARLEAMATPDRHGVLDTPGGRLRRGFGGTLVNLLPFEDDHFHLSAGGRLFGRPRASQALDERGLLAVPRTGGGWRGGGRRFAPAFLMGVDEQAGAVTLGVDAGVVMGPAMDRGMRGGRGLRRGGAGGGGGMPGGANGVARVTMGLRF